MAPGGTVAFIQPTGLERFFASIVGSPAHAAITGLAGVAGATVELVEVDATGATVGAVIATATTDGNGAYSLEAPEGFTGGTQYIVRIAGSTDVLESRVTGTSVDIDPLTDATSDLVTIATTASGLDAVTIAEVDEIQDVVEDVAQELDPTGLDSTALTSDLVTTIGKDEEAANIINSTSAAGEICGTVIDSNSNPLANIRIVARDFGNWVTRAKTKTAADGSYCLNVPVAGDTDAFTGNTLSGEYILAAFNFTGDANDAGRHASEWWSTGGTVYSPINAEMISVASVTPVTGKNFQLEPGARITGSVTTFDTLAAVEGAKVTIRDYYSNMPIASAGIKADGTYRVNVIPGRYLVEVNNRTIQPYASEIYDGADGANNRNLASPVQVSAGQARTIDFELEAGSKLSGTISDGVTTDPVTGMIVFINDPAGGPVARLRTNKEGKYRIWLKPTSYDIYAYGQRSEGLDLSSNQVVDFNASVSEISGVVEDASTNPVSQAKMRLYDATGTALAFAVSNSDGSYAVYTDQTGDHLLEARIDAAASAGGQVYNGHTQLLAGDAINIASVGDPAAADFSLADGGVLEVIIYEGNGTGTPDRSTSVGNFQIQLRDDDNLATAGTGTTGASRFITTRTLGDGSVQLTIPAGIYDRLHMTDPAATLTPGACGSVTITSGVTTTAEYFVGDGVCIKS